MTANRLRAAHGAFLMLVCATLLSAWVGERPGTGRFAVVAVLALAAFKARLVVLHFMELKDVAPPWRWVFEGWIAGVTTLILLFYFLS